MADGSPASSLTPHVRCIVKVGGAAITDKQGPPDSPRPDVIRSVAQQLAAACSDDSALIIVHGAGSCGHPQASSHNVAHGPLTDAHVRIGFALTRASVTKLNHMVVDALLEAGLPACALSPCGTWRTSSRQVVSDGVDQVQSLLLAGLVPVLHGDAVLDDTLGCTILSGDTLLLHLAKALQPDCCVFLTNVAGVYDRPPEEHGATLLRHIAVLPDGSWSDNSARGPVDMRSAAGDVTGGIARKVQEAVRIAGLGIPVMIAEAGSSHAAVACSMGRQLLLDLAALKRWQGTLFTLHQA